MHASLRQFIVKHCRRSPDARMPLVEFVRAFQDSLPARDSESWRRGRIVTELVSGGFAIGMDDDKRFHIAGMCLAGQWRAVNGALQFKPGKLVTAQNYVEVLRRAD